MTQPTRLLDILIRAIETENGISVISESISAQQLRRKLYNFRERLRAKEINDYNRLSFVVKDSNQLLILQRPDILCESPKIEVAVRTLSPLERIHPVRSRGKSKTMWL